jgi:hypothetical protein
MSGPRIDLFDDPPWSGEAPADEVPGVSPRPCLTASLALVALLLFSMAFPWLTGAATTAIGQTSPFSTLLSRGWSPGTQNWGFLMLALGALTVLAIVLGILWPRKGLLISLLFLMTILASIALTEAFAPSESNLHADYGAWIGVPAVVFAWCCIAVATALALHWSPARSGPGVAAGSTARIQ